MDLAYTEQQNAFRAEVRAWLAAQAAGAWSPGRRPMAGAGST
jgi:predicted transcriptional regulator